MIYLSRREREEQKKKEQQAQSQNKTPRVSPTYHPPNTGRNIYQQAGSSIGARATQNNRPATVSPPYIPPVNKTVQKTSTRPITAPQNNLPKSTTINKTYTPPSLDTVQAGRYDRGDPFSYTDSAGVQRSNTMIARNTGKIRHPKTPPSYEKIAERAEQVYNEYKEHRKAYKDRFGRFEHPEIYYGWAKQKKTLANLQKEYQQLLGYLNQHYREMEIEPMFSIEGTPGDLNIYKGQIDTAFSDLKRYTDISDGMPDPAYVQQRLTFAARMQKAVDVAEQNIAANSTRRQMDFMPTFPAADEAANQANAMQESAGEEIDSSKSERYNFHDNVLTDADKEETSDSSYKSYDASECLSKYLFAVQQTIIFADNMAGAGSTSGYAGYGIVIAMNSYQANQYKKGYESGRGVRFYNPWHIVPQ